MKSAHRIASQAKRHAMNLTTNPVWRAFAKVPMSQAQQVDIALAARIAFEEVSHGRGIDDHIDTLACAANVSLVLAERGYGPECEPKIIEAQAALMRIKARQQQGKAIGLDGPGAQALRDLMDTHEQQIEHAGKAEVASALIEINTRRVTGQVMSVQAVAR